MFTALLADARSRVQQLAFPVNPSRICKNEEEKKKDIFSEEEKLDRGCFNGKIEMVVSDIDPLGPRSQLLSLRIVGMFLN